MNIPTHKKFVNQTLGSQNTVTIFTGQMKEKTPFP